MMGIKAVLKKGMLRFCFCVKKKKNTHIILPACWKWHMQPDMNILLPAAAQYENRITL